MNVNVSVPIAGNLMVASAVWAMVVLLADSVNDIAFSR